MVAEVTSLGRKHLRWPVLAAGIAGYLVHARLWSHYRVDDAYINLRYARNLLAGQGLVFNPGERVEGFTNPLWQGFSVLAEAGPADPLAFLGWLGLVFGVFSLLLVLAIDGQLAGPDDRPAPGRLAATALSVWVPAACLPLALNTNSGLETTAFTCWLLAGAWCWIHAGSKDARRWPLLASLFFGLATLTRPEGIVPFALAVLGLSLRRPGIRRIRFMVLPGLLLVAGLLAFRLGYYGRLLPNTFYAKSDLGASQLVRGLDYLAGFCLNTGFGPLVLVCLAAAAWIGIRRLAGKAPGFSREAPLVFVMAAALVLLAIPVAEGGDWMPQWRFFVPALPFLALGAAGLSRAAARRRPRAGIALALVLLGLFAVFESANLWRSQKPIAEYLKNLDRRECFARWFQDAGPPGATVASSDMGLVPYHNPSRRFIDLNGLTDPVIARNRGRRVADQVVGQNPDFMILVSFSDSRLRLGGIHWLLARHPVTRRNYRMVVASPSFDSGSVYRPAGRALILFARKDHPPPGSSLPRACRLDLSRLMPTGDQPPNRENNASR